MKKKINDYLNMLNIIRKKIKVDHMMHFLIEKFAIFIVMLKKVEWKKYRLISFQKLKLKLSPQKIKFLGFMTVCCLLMGFIFGQILEIFLATDQPVSATMEIDFDANRIYVIYLGNHDDFERVLEIEGRIRNLGYGVGIHLYEEAYVVFSHIAKSENQLASVRDSLNEKDINYEIKAIERNSDELKWHYFFKAVHQIPYEMNTEFIEVFEQDEMFIWGYYVMLANPSLDSLALERQQMLREIYQWLNNHE